MDECPVCRQASIDPAKVTVTVYDPHSNVAAADAEGRTVKMVRCSNDSCGALLRWNDQTQAWQHDEQ